MFRQAFDERRRGPDMVPLPEIVEGIIGEGIDVGKLLIAEDLWYQG